MTEVTTCPVLSIMSSVTGIKADAYNGCVRTQRNKNEREAFRIVVGRSFVMKALLAVKKQTLQGYSSLLVIHTQWFRVCESLPHCVRVLDRNEVTRRLCRRAVHAECIVS